jgi:hypothetical protein
MFAWPPRAGNDCKDARTVATPHFDGYPAVLVRLERIGLDDLTEVVVEAWLVRAPRRLAQGYAPRLSER